MFIKALCYCVCCVYDLDMCACWYTIVCALCIWDVSSSLHLSTWCDRVILCLCLTNVYAYCVKWCMHLMHVCIKCVCCVCVYFKIPVCLVCVMYVSEASSACIQPIRMFHFHWLYSKCEYFLFSHFQLCILISLFYD